MNNRRIVVNGRSYFVDIDSYNFSSSLAIQNAESSGDEEIKIREMHALIVRAVGLPVLLTVPMTEFSEFMEQVMKTLLENFRK